MATTPVILDIGTTGYSGLTLKLYAMPTAGTPDPTIANGAGDTMAEQTNAKGWYTANVDEALAGVYRAVVESSGGEVVSRGYCRMADTTTPVHASDSEITDILDDTAAILVDTAEIGAAGAGLTAVPWNASWDAEVESECNDALVALSLDHLLSTSVTGTDVADNSVFAQLVSKSTTADWDSYSNRFDSLEAISDDQTTIDTNVNSILVDTAEIGAAGAGLSAIPWNSSWDAEVQSECQDALVVNGLDHLVSAAVTGTDVTDNSIMAKLVSASATADWDDFVNTTDSLQAVRDRGDSAWATATGFSTHSAADVRSEMDSNSTQLAAIVSDIAALEQPIASGTAQAGGSSSITLAAGTSFAESEIDGCRVLLTGGTGAGQERIIVAYEATPKLANVEPNWTTNPSSDSTYLILPAHSYLAAIPSTGQADIRGAVGLSAADLDTQLAAIVADTNELQGDWADGGRLDLLLDATSTHSAADVATSVLTTQMTESYAADGTAPTLAQSQFLISQALTEFAISGTTITVKQLDGTTAAATYTLDSDTTPTSRTRAT